MEEKIKQISFDNYHLRLIYLGIVMNIVLPLLLLGIAFILRRSAFSEERSLDPGLVFVALAIVSIVDLAFTYLFKKTFIAKHELKRTSTLTDGETGAQDNTKGAAVTMSVVIYSLALAPSVYGFVYFLLGGDYQGLILFVAMTMLGFLLFKPKEQELRVLSGDRIPDSE
jgi:hypothetical protein